MRGDTRALNNRIHRLYSIFSLLIKSFIKIYRKGEAARILPTNPAVFFSSSPMKVPIRSMVDQCKYYYRVWANERKEGKREMCIALIIAVVFLGMEKRQANVLTRRSERGKGFRENPWAITQVINNNNNNSYNNINRDIPALFCT